MPRTNNADTDKAAADAAAAKAAADKAAADEAAAKAAADAEALAAAKAAADAAKEETLTALTEAFNAYKAATAEALRVNAVAPATGADADTIAEHAIYVSNIDAMAESDALHKFVYAFDQATRVSALSRIVESGDAITGPYNALVRHNGIQYTIDKAAVTGRVTVSGYKLPLRNRIGQVTKSRDYLDGLSTEAVSVDKAHENVALDSGRAGRAMATALNSAPVKSTKTSDKPAKAAADNAANAAMAAEISEVKEQLAQLTQLLKAAAAAAN